MAGEIGLSAVRRPHGQFTGASLPIMFYSSETGRVATHPVGLLRRAHYPENVRYCYACSMLTTLELWPPSLHASFVTTLRRSCGVWKQARRSKSSKTTALWRRSSRFRVGGNGCPQQRSAMNLCGWDQIPPACLRNCGQLSPRRRTIYLGDPPTGVGRYVRLYRP